MATHDHAIVDAMRRRVVQLDRGRVVRDENRGVYETVRRSTPPETAPAAPASTRPPAADEDHGAVDPETSTASDALRQHHARLRHADSSSIDEAASGGGGAEPVTVGEITGEVPVVTEPGVET
jgi:hypothetical protein